MNPDTNQEHWTLRSCNIVTNKKRSSQVANKLPFRASSIGGHFSPTHSPRVSPYKLRMKSPRRTVGGTRSMVGGENPNEHVVYTPEGGLRIPAIDSTYTLHSHQIAVYNLKPKDSKIHHSDAVDSTVFVSTRPELRNYEFLCIKVCIDDNPLKVRYNYRLTRIWNLDQDSWESTTDAPQATISGTRNHRIGQATCAPQATILTILWPPNEDFGRPSKHSGTHFQSTFQMNVAQI